MHHSTKEVALCVGGTGGATTRAKRCRVQEDMGEGAEERVQSGSTRKSGSGQETWAKTDWCHAERLRWQETTTVDQSHSRGKEGEWAESGDSEALRMSK